jgi:hypothetical protein
MDYTTKKHLQDVLYWQNGMNGLQYALNHCFCNLFYL